MRSARLKKKMLIGHSLGINKAARGESSTSGTRENDWQVYVADAGCPSAFAAAIDDIGIVEE